MISLRDVHKVYATGFGEKTVLSGVDFDLQMGERLGILGRNGAGKSTLIRLISGAEKPTRGLVERTMSVSWPLAFGGAFQPQLTGIDNIRFITSVYGQDFDRNLAFVEQFAELGPYLREPVRSYSSGMRARLAFAISMIIEFDCFLIDEIGAVGDARFHARCNHELFEKRGDRAMVIISHDAGYIREHCNRWAVLHDGKLVQFADFEEAYASYKELIGAEIQSEPNPIDFSNRARMIETSQHSALSDERFRALVQEGDWARDQRNWQAATEFYAQALALYPYQRSYWVQLGHVEKEQGRYAEAEIAYRTAVALGEPLADVEEHVLFVMEQSGDGSSAYQVHAPSNGIAAEEPPARADIDALMWLMGSDAAPDSTDMLRLMRECDSLDQASAMIAHGLPTNGASRSEDDPEKLALIECIFGLPAASRGRALCQEALVDLLHQKGAIDAWPLTKDAIKTDANRNSYSPNSLH